MVRRYGLGLGVETLNGPRMPVPVTDDGPYRIVDPPDDFVVEGLKAST